MLQLLYRDHGRPERVHDVLNLRSRQHDLRNKKQSLNSPRLSGGGQGDALTPFAENSSDRASPPHGKPHKAEAEQKGCGRLGDENTETHWGINFDRRGNPVPLQVGIRAETSAKPNRTQSDQIIPCAYILNTRGPAKVMQNKLLIVQACGEERPQGTRRRVSPITDRGLKAVQKRWIGRKIPEGDRTRKRQN